ncbi:MAG: DUF4830 domain-containing protein [Oscillospiraceae bacterium]|nr:DUF4830 domain-containing protein [Oscillospiraceae bacterium]
MKEHTKRSRLPLVLGLLLLAAAVIWLGWRLIRSGESGIPGETEQQRISYIESFGWDAGITRVDVKEIRIPVDFDEVYEEYNDIQRQQGFDLRRYRAHSVRQYTYEISRTDDDPVPMLAHLLVENGVIIGADITSAQAGGFTGALAAD